MFTVKTAVATLGFVMPALVAASGAAAQRRELTYALRQMYAREVYDVPTAPNPPSCASDYDSYDANTGTCVCGQGRVEVSQGLCGVAPGATEFRVVALSEPQPINLAITWSQPVTGPGSVMNAAQCGGVCAEDSACIGYYLTPAEGDATASCWMLGESGAYDSPSGTGLPFTPSGSRMARRAEGQRGAIGAEGGQLGIAQAAAAPGDGPVACNAEFGDRESEDFSGCICGPGRAQNDDGICVFFASQAARLVRRVKRDVFEGVPW